MKPQIILAIDPGSSKCGVAIVAAPLGKILEKFVAPVEDLKRLLEECFTRYTKIGSVFLGDGTGSDAVSKVLMEFPRCPMVHVVDEKNTSMLARKRYCLEVPAKGWRKLLPTGMRTPEEPYDDYVALILAERWIASQQHDGTSDTGGSAPTMLTIV